MEAAMARCAAAIAASILLISGSVGGVRAEESGRLPVAQQEPYGDDAPEVIARGRVQHVYGPQLFTLARDGDAPDRALLVFAPSATTPPIKGSGLTARGTLRRCDEAELETVGGCDQ